MIPTYLLLLLVGAVTAVRLDFLNIPVKYGFCKNPPVQSGFNVEQFFQKKWYTWKNTGSFFFGTSGSCSATESNVDGEKINILHYQYEPLLKRFVSIQGEADKNFAAFKGSRFPVDYHLYNRINFTIALAVVDTDYDNWAVVYFCRQMFLSKIEMSWILLRHKDVVPDEAQMSIIDTSLSGIESKMDDFQLLDNTKCGVNEPHL